MKRVRRAAPQTIADVNCEFGFWLLKANMQKNAFREWVCSLKTDNKMNPKAKDSGSLKRELKDPKIEAGKPLYLFRYE
jgi:hypothetical protein